MVREKAAIGCMPKGVFCSVRPWRVFYQSGSGHGKRRLTIPPPLSYTYFYCVNAYLEGR